MRVGSFSLSFSISFLDSEYQFFQLVYFVIVFISGALGFDFGDNYFFLNFFAGCY
jgi:hypothetical protein